MKVNTTQAIKLVQPPDTKTQKPSTKKSEGFPQTNAGALASREIKLKFESSRAEITTCQTLYMLTTRESVHANRKMFAFFVTVTYSLAPPNVINNYWMRLSMRS